MAPTTETHAMTTLTHQPASGTDAGTTTIDTVIIGGGQAGLAVGHALRDTGREFAILDAHPRIGDAWRRRWDSLKLFTPAQYNSLPGYAYPAPHGTFVTKDEFADYLEDYARRFELPVRTGTRVTRVSPRGDGYLVQTDRGAYEATNVIVAMGTYQRPKLPPFADELDPSVRQLHSFDYQRLDQLADGPVLLVGAGNSSADIAIEVAATHETWVAGTHPGVIPFRTETWIARHVLIGIVRLVGHRLLNTANPVGRKARPTFLSRGTPLVRVKPSDLAAAGVHRVGRIVGVEDGRPVTDEGERLDVRNVIWCTGYQPSLGWLDVPVLGDGGEPDHERGIVAEAPGLYVVGLEYLRSATSATITGVGRDARYVVRHLDRTRPRISARQVAAR